MTAGVSTDEVIAFRLAAHHLTDRLAGDRLLDAAGRCGVQDSPPGSAAVALHARVRGVTPGGVAAAIADDRSLLQTWSLRGAPYIFPTADAAVFTAGVLPPTEAALRHLVPGVQQAMTLLAMSLPEAVERCGSEVAAVLSGRGLAIGPLGKELAARVGRRLDPSRRSTWQADGPYAPGQPLGEAVVHFCLRVLALQGVVCFGPRAGNQAPFVLVEEWLGHPIPVASPELARAELARRYLRCYGPSGSAQLASWLGVSPGDAGPWWDLIRDDITAVDFGGTAWVLTADLEALRSAAPPDGVRLLPPHDPYLQMRDRETILDTRRHAEVWRAAGAPGAVLAGGRIVGCWRSRTRGLRLRVAITTFEPLSSRELEALHAEVEMLAMVRGASSAEVALDAP